MDFYQETNNYLPDGSDNRLKSKNSKTQYDGYQNQITYRMNKRVEETEYLTDAFSSEAVHFYWEGS